MNYTPRILIVDDSPSVRQTIINNFKDTKIEFLEAGDAYTAIDIINKSEEITEVIDLIVTDITMPGINGLDLVKEKNTKGGTLPYLPVIVMSDFRVINAHLSEAWQLNITDIIQKPFKASELRAKVFCVVDTLMNGEQSPDNKFLVISASNFQREFFRKILLQCNSKCIDLVGEYAAGTAKIFNNVGTIYNLIITDWQIGDATCLSFINEIRSREEFTNIPICVTMSSFNASTISQLLNYPLLTVLNKKSSKDDLNFKIRYLSHLKDFFTKEKKDDQ